MNTDAIVPLEEALQLTRPFRSPAQEAGISIVRAADALRRTLAGVIEPQGITLQQFNVLRILRGAGPDGLPTLAVGERMIERMPGITRLLDRLEADGLVSRRRCSEDRRRVYAMITEVGLELLARLDEPVARAEDEIFAGFGDGELRTLIGGLDRVRGRLEPPPAPEAER
jgi:MarR family transcriptional regulator, organic hydroperoxide resistance regulator